MSTPPKAGTTPSTDLDYQWRAYTDFWKIVGRHSKLWNYSKAETILKLQEFIEALLAQERNKARLQERIELARKPVAALPSIFLNDKAVQAALKKEAIK